MLGVVRSCRTLVGGVQNGVRTGVGWLSDEACDLQECLDEEDAEVDRLVETHVKPPLVGGSRRSHITHLACIHCLGVCV